jgi:6-pyruvoyltetrahydropterin/6-carboxytetrahydropterin synthase
MKVYEITRAFEWDMAHRIPGHAGKCRHLHGHRYRAEVTCVDVDAQLSELGFVVDFSLVKELVGGWVDAHWDHNTCYFGGDAYMEALDRAQDEVDDSPGTEWFVMGAPPTAENLAEKLFEVASELLGDHGIKVVCIDLWETPNCRARFEKLEESG